MKTNTADQPKGVAFLADMLKASITKGKSPLVRSMKPTVDPTPARPSPEAIEDARDTAQTMARILDQLDIARLDSDTAAANVTAREAQGATLADAILAGGPLPDTVGDISAEARTHAITRASWHAANTITPQASRAIALLENERQARHREKLTEAEGALRQKLAGLVTAAAIETAIATDPELQALRTAAAPRFIGSLLPCRLHTPTTSNPNKRGKKMATGKAVAVLQPWRLSPLPADCPPAARRDPWSPRAVAVELRALLDAFDQTSTPPGD
jgi:hypothetical protein